MKNSSYKMIKIKHIIANKEQPRTHFEKEKIQELALSIQQNGLLQPIVVRPHNGKYQIVVGERRYRACKLAGLNKIPCIISEYDDKQVDTVSIIENIQREDLSVVEEAKAYQVLLKKHGFLQHELADKVGKKQSTIANKIRLLKLEESVLDALDQKKISERHARAMLSVDHSTQIKVLKEILDKSLTVNQTEAYIKRLLEPKKHKTIKKVSKNVKIAWNTLQQAITMIEKTGVEVSHEEKDKDDEYVITIHIKK